VSWGYHPDAYPIGETGPSAGPDDRDLFGSTPRIRFLEFEGTRDVTPWLVVPVAIDFQAALGWDAIRGRIAELIAYTRHRIQLRPATPADPRLCGSMVAFQLPMGVDVGRLKKGLWADRIEVPLILRPDRMLIRVSCHFYTTEAEIDRLAEVLPGLIGR
jgi:isopenicillin-N epimerase